MGNTATAQVSVDIPKEIIDAQVRAAIAKALSADPEKLVKAVIDSAMDVRSRPYDKTSIFQDGINNVIRQAATEVFKEFVESIRDKIRDRLIEKLKAQPDEFAEKITDSVILGLSKSFHVSANMVVDD